MQKKKKKKKKNRIINQGKNRVWEMTCLVEMSIQCFFLFLFVTLEKVVAGENLKSVTENHSVTISYDSYWKGTAFCQFRSTTWVV